MNQTKHIITLLVGVLTSVSGIAILITFQMMDSKNSAGFMDESFILVPVGYLFIGIGLIFALVYRTQRKRSKKFN